MLDELGHRADRRRARRDPRAPRTASSSARPCDARRPARARVAIVTRRRRAPRTLALPGRPAAGVHARRPRRRHRVDARASSSAQLERALCARARSARCSSRSPSRLGRVRARGDARPQRQRRRRLLDREPRPDGRPHRRLGHGRAADDALRRGLPGAARRRGRRHPRRRRRDRRLEHPVRPRARDRRAARDRDEPARLALAPRSRRKATGYPIAKVAAKLAVGYTLDEIPNDLTGTTPASFEPTLDYVVVKFPRFAFEKFPGADATLGTQMKSVGEAMGIGRTFTEAFLKAMRSRELDARPRRRGRRSTSSPTACTRGSRGQLRRIDGALARLRSLDDLVADDWLG